MQETPNQTLLTTTPTLNMLPVTI